MLKRSHYAGSLRAEDEGQRVTLCGWVHKTRDMGHLVFLDLRDREGIAQVVFPSEHPGLLEEAKKLRNEYVVAVRGLDYYTKTIFEIVTGESGQQNAVLGGGRYDDMMKDFGGPDICGTGFAMGVERLIALLDFKPEKRKFVYVIHVGEEAKKRAVVAAKELRAAGIEALVEFSARGFKSQFARANKLGSGWVLIIGEDEIRSGLYKFKDMATGEQRDVRPEGVVDLLRPHLEG